MASGGVVNVLECPCCFEEFDTPKILPCGHTVCLSCIQRIARQCANTFSCPSCRRQINMPVGGVKNLTTNFQLMTIITAPKYGTHTHKCATHIKENVVLFCKDCNLDLCSVCIAKDHQRHDYVHLEDDDVREDTIQKLSTMEQKIQRYLGKTHDKFMKKAKMSKNFCQKGEKVIESVLEEIKRRLTADIINCQKENEEKLCAASSVLQHQTDNLITSLKETMPSFQTASNLDLLRALTKMTNLEEFSQKMALPLSDIDIPDWFDDSNLVDPDGATNEELLEIVMEILDVEVEQEEKETGKPLLDGYLFHELGVTPVASRKSRIDTDFIFNINDMRGKKPYFTPSCDNVTIWSCFAHWLPNDYLAFQMRPKQEFMPSSDHCIVDCNISIFNPDTSYELDVIFMRKQYFPTNEIGYLWGFSSPISRTTYEHTGLVNPEGKFGVRVQVLNIKLQSSKDSLPMHSLHKTLLMRLKLEQMQYDKKG